MENVCVTPQRGLVQGWFSLPQCSVDTAPPSLFWSLVLEKEGGWRVVQGAPNTMFDTVLDMWCKWNNSQSCGMNVLVDLPYMCTKTS